MNKMNRKNQIAAISTESEEKMWEQHFTYLLADMYTIFHVDITVKFPKVNDKTNKLRLWKDSATKEAESFLGEKTWRNRSFQSICQFCYIKVLKNVYQ